MRRRISGGLVVVFVSAMLLLACAPAAPTPTPTPAPVPQPAAQAPLVTPALSPEDESWAKVVEAAKKEGGLTIYSFHLYADTAVKVSQAFRQKTGLKLEIVSGPPVSLRERINTERRAGQNLVSIMTGAAADAQVLFRDGQTQSIGYLPELKEESVRRYDPWMDKSGHILSLNMIIEGPWINTDLVRPGAEPRSWRDLLKIEWQGKIGMDDPDIETPANYIYQGLTSRGRLDDAYFKELGKQKIRFYPNMRMTLEALARGEVSLIIPAYASVGYPFLKEGVPLKALDMTEGVVTFRGGSVTIIKTAPQPNAARVFINWLFSQEGQTVFHKYNGSTGFRKDVPSFEAPGAQLTPANPIMTDAEDQFKADEIRVAKIFKKLLQGG